MHNDTTNPTTPVLRRPDPVEVRRAIDRRSFATLATSSPAGRPHVAGVLYEAVDDALYVSTMRPSRKARNIEANPDVAVVIPIRRLPVGPPSTVQFQTTATVLDSDGPEIQALVAAGELTSITGHGELELAGGCFLRIALPRRLVTYGLGMPIRALISDPLSGGGLVELEARA
ncbi:MAG: pyridoxamine 5'-phosphate oxidase family protein [Actinomycetota bacterium]